jgi:protein associated with RNAse G/E
MYSHLERSFLFFILINAIKILRNTMFFVIYNTRKHKKCQTSEFTQSYKTSTYPEHLKI